MLEKLTINERENKTNRKVYTLFSVGQRGSGKTVFLASGYQSLKNDRSANTKVWLECTDSEDEENIDKILNYVAKTGHYPPATLKISNFDFTLKEKVDNQVRDLGIVRWWDVPGESCQLYNLAFLTMVMSADGCLLFLDATTLADNDKKDKNSLQTIQILADIIQQNKTKFALAIIVSKCDLARQNQDRWQSILSLLQHLESDLKTRNINHQIFYSEVLIDPSSFTLKTNQGLESLSWLFSQLNIDIKQPIKEPEPEKPLPISQPLQRKNLLTFLLGLIVISLFSFGGIIALEKLAGNKPTIPPVIGK